MTKRGFAHWAADWRRSTRRRAKIKGTGFLRPAGAVDDPTTPPIDADPRWSDTLLDERAAFLANVGYGDLARDVMAWVRANRDLFDGIDDAVLCHGNYFDVHVAVDSGGDGGEPTAVIDFEHALAAPAEWDYLRTVLPVFGPGADHEIAESTFREAYESVRPLPAGFDERREALVLCNGVSYLRSLHLQRGDQDSPQAVARRARRLAASARNRLDALRDGGTARRNDA